MKYSLILCILLSACEMPKAVVYPEPDQCMRAELFKSCMASLPAGPVATQYNDWDEVVEACQDSSYHQSLRNPDQIKPECSL